MSGPRVTNQRRMPQVDECPSKLVLVRPAADLEPIRAANAPNAPNGKRRGSGETQMLTKRQFEVLRYLAEGAELWEYQHMAPRLWHSNKTSRTARCAWELIQRRTVEGLWKHRAVGADGREDYRIGEGYRILRITRAGRKLLEGQL